MRGIPQIGQDSRSQQFAKGLGFGLESPAMKTITFLVVSALASVTFADDLTDAEVQAVLKLKKAGFSVEKVVEQYLALMAPPPAPIVQAPIVEPLPIVEPAIIAPPKLEPIITGVYIPSQNFQPQRVYQMPSAPPPTNQAPK